MLGPFHRTVHEGWELWTRVGALPTRHPKAATVREAAVLLRVLSKGLELHGIFSLSILKGEKDMGGEGSLIFCCVSPPEPEQHLNAASCICQKPFGIPNARRHQYVRHALSNFYMSCHQC